MRFETLAEAIQMVNQTGYGLTSGLQSLDDREQRQWLAGILRGNLYINRTTVGAVVLRQPFGGMGRSAFGPGIKAGGPNYVAEFMDLADSDADAASDKPAEDKSAEEKPADPRLAQLYDQLHNYGQGQSPLPVGDLNRLSAALSSQAKNYREEFGQQHDHFRLVGQDNFRRYLPVGKFRIRIHPADTAFEILARVCAARTAGCHLTVSTPPGYQSPVLEFLRTLAAPWAGAAEFVEESDDALAAVVAGRRTDRVRYAAPDRVPAVVRQAAGASGVYLAAQPVLVEGRVELLWYVQEQSISFDYHRYGNSVLVLPKSGPQCCKRSSNNDSPLPVVGEGLGVRARRAAGPDGSPIACGAAARGVFLRPEKCLVLRHSYSKGIGATSDQRFARASIHFWSSSLSFSSGSFKVLPSLVFNVTTPLARPRNSASIVCFPLASVHVS